MLSRAFGLLVAGAIGGLLAWMVSEPMAPKVFASDVAWATFEGKFGLFAGLFIGLFLGAASGLSQGSRGHMLRGLMAGAIIGAIAGPIGVKAGSALYNFILGPTKNIAGVNLLSAILARIAGWALFGSLIGLAEGAIGRSTRRAFHGFIGGLLGGAIGGLMFDVSGMIVGAATQSLQGGNEVGTIPRAVGLVSVGAGIGLLVGIVEALARQAWVRVIYGRNEGKEYLVDAPQNFIGRSERAHIPIFGDQNIMPMHAMIVRKSGQYTLVDGGSPLGTGLNGQRVTQALLTSGDMIHVGNFNIQFLTKSGRGQRVAGPERFAPQPFPVAPAAVIPGAAQPAGIPMAMSMPTVALNPGGYPTSSPGAPTQAPKATTYALVATTGPLTGQCFEISGTVEVGRECLAIPMSFDAMASRRHASLSVTSNGLTVSDFGSTNGTLVNGQKVQSQVVHGGDTVQIGATTFRVEVA